MSDSRCRAVVAALVGVATAVTALGTATSSSAAEPDVRAVASTTSYPVGPHSLAEWKRHPWVGTPTGPERARTMDGQTGYLQSFSNHAEIVTSSFGSFVVSGDMFTKYGSGSPMAGWPMDEAFEYDRLGYRARAQYFSSAVDHRRTGLLLDRVGVPAYWIINGLLSSYIRNGYSGRVGYPTGDQVYVGRCREYLQVMTQGTLYSDGRWCPSTAYAQPALSQPSAGAGYRLGYGWNGTSVYFAQRALGMRTSSMSTTIGPRTSAAIKAFQSRHGLAVTGAIDRTTWDRLATGRPYSTSTWKHPYGVSTSAGRGTRVNAMVAWAKSQSGRPYLWGGTGNPGTSAGYDCAGFVLQAMRYAGVAPARIANYYDEYPASDLSYRMWVDGEFQHVSTRSLQPGDLVFYGSTKVHHVALYVGGGNAIQAVGSRVQTLSVWNTSGWPKIYGAARPVSSVTPNSAGWQAGVRQTHTTSPFTARPLRVNDAAPTLLIDGAPFSPRAGRATGGRLTDGVIAPVAAGQHLKVGSANRIVWIGGGFVIDVTAGSGPAPRGATQALVLSAAAASGIGVDAAVTPVS